MADPEGSTAGGVTKSARRVKVFEKWMQMVHSEPILCRVRVDFPPNILCNFCLQSSDIRDAGERRKYVKRPNRPYVTAKYKEYFEKDQYTTIQCGSPVAYAGKTKSRF